MKNNMNIRTKNGQKFRPCLGELWTIFLNSAQIIGRYFSKRFYSYENILQMDFTSSFSVYRVHSLYTRELDFIEIGRFFSVIK
jgi:hypothetical protein